MSLMVRNQAGHSSRLAYHRELYWSPDIFRFMNDPPDYDFSLHCSMMNDAFIYMKIQTSEDHHTLSEWPSTPRGEDLSMADEIGTPRKCQILRIRNIHETDFRYIIKSIAYNEMKWELSWIACDLAFVSHYSPYFSILFQARIYLFMRKTIKAVV